LAKGNFLKPLVFLINRALMTLRLEELRSCVRSWRKSTLRT